MISKGSLVTFENYASIPKPPVYIVISDPYEWKGNVVTGTYQVVDIFDETPGGYGPRMIFVERLRLVSQ